MDIWLQFALLGLGIGAIYAAVGTGVVVTFRGTGVINFAVAAMAVWGVFVCDELRTTGDLVLPVIGIPDRIPLPGGETTWVAVLAGVLSVALLSLAISYLLIRRLSSAPVLARVVSSLGLMIFFQGLAILKFGTEARIPQPILPNDPVTIGSSIVPMDRLWLAAIVIVLAALFWAWFRWTHTGLAVVAAAENEQAAAFAGFSPNRLAAITALLGLTATTFVLILASPTGNLDASTYTLLIVPALAIGLLGRLQSVPLTVIAGLALGSLQSCLTYAKSQVWFPDWGRQGVNDAVPFLVVVMVLFLFGRALPERGAAIRDRLPPVVIPRIDARRVAVLVACGLVAILVTSGSYRFGVINSLIFILITMSLVLLTGMVGQVSVAQAAFAGTAGFVLSKIGTGIPFPFSMLLAALAATALGVMVGVPALRIRGAQLAVVTLAAAVAIEQLIFRNPEISPVGGNPIPAPSLFGWDLSVRDGRNIATVRFGILVLVIVTVAALGVANLMRSGTGRRFVAVRANERAGASLGIDVSSVKLAAFAASAFLAGLGGTLIGYSREQLSPDSFGLLVGLTMLAFAYLGGITSLSGAIIAATFFPLGINYVVSDRLIGSRLDGFELYYILLGGLALAASPVVNPIGIAGDLQEKREERRQKRAEKQAAKQQGKESEEQADAAGEGGPVTVAVAEGQPVERTIRQGPDVPLRVEQLSVAYGGVRAVDGLSLEVPRGRIVGLIGPNGAGKTTFIDAVTGYVPATGSVRTGDVDLTSLPPHERAAAGVVRTWQSVELFEELTVAENVLIGAERSGVLRSMAIDLVAPNRTPRGPAAWATDLLGLDDVLDRHPMELSLGRQKLLGVARALALDPTVLLLDEPAAGLDTRETAALAARLRTIVDHGISILLVDHDMGLILDVCDDLCVMAFGKVLAHGPPDEVRHDAGVVDAYLGEPATVPK